MAAMRAYQQSGVVAQQSEHATLVKQAADLRAQLRAIEAKVLEPAAADLEAYKELVGKPDSGVIRLLPRATRRTSEHELLTIRGGGAYYSFARLTHEYGYGSDIELTGGAVSVGFAGYDFGWIDRLEEDAFDAFTQLASASLPRKSSLRTAEMLATLPCRWLLNSASQNPGQQKSIA